MRLGEVVIFVSFSLVCVFVCIMSVLFLHVLLRCVLEPSHTCFLTSIVCSESDRLLDTHRDRIYQGSSLAGRLSSSKQFSSSAALHRGRCSAVLGFIIIFHSYDDFSSGVSCFQIPDSLSQRKVVSIACLQSQPAGR